jgi:hypothetical protein
MEWTTDKPTEPGLYWAWDRIHILAVDAYIHRGKIVLFELGEGYNLMQSVDAFSHFIGPLPIPDPPQGG